MSETASWKTVRCTLKPCVCRSKMPARCGLYFIAVTACSHRATGSHRSARNASEADEKQSALFDQGASVSCRPFGCGLWPPRVLRQIVHRIAHRGLAHRTDLRLRALRHRLQQPVGLRVTELLLGGIAPSRCATVSAACGSLTTRPSLMSCCNVCNDLGSPRPTSSFSACRWSSGEFEGLPSTEFARSSVSCFTRAISASITDCSA